MAAANETGFAGRVQVRGPRVRIPRGEALWLTARRFIDLGRAESMMCWGAKR